MKSVLTVLTALLVFVGLAMAQTNDQAQPATSGNQATANQTQNATPADQNQSATSADQSTTHTTQTTTTRRHHRGAAAADQNGAAADQNGTNSNGKLPQTASPLPLLGLLGMGSLGIGAISRRKRK